MDKRKRTIVITLVTFLLFGGIILTCPSYTTVFAMPQEKIETIILKKEPAGISPKSLKVKLGTTIVWFNASPESITIKFIEKLGIACKAPVNFHSDLFGYYETSTIEQGATASICFIYKGEYTYEVKRLVTNDQGNPTEEIATGKIVAVE